MRSFSVFAVLYSFSLWKNHCHCRKIDLPEVFLPYYFSSYPSVAEECKSVVLSSSGGKIMHILRNLLAHLDKNICWGYEDDCEASRKYSHPICDGDHKGWVKSKKDQVDTFYKQADFGYVRNYRNSMKLICQPKLQTDSALECSEDIEFCRARNIMIDFRALNNCTSPVMYDMDVLNEGDIGGHCKLINSKALSANVGRLSSLQTWLPELRNFVEFKESIMADPDAHCDQVITTPVYIMKIDATVNMYHHFCDFFNLFASWYVNSTATNPDAFPTNVKILIWRTYQYSSSFEATFRAFTSHPIMTLSDVKGKRICFKNVVFPLLPRMIFGLFYNTPLIWGCRNSGLFHAFSKFVLHRLRIDQRPAPNLKKLKITILSRETKYRKILNEDSLIEKLVELPNIETRRVAFTWKMDFTEQLQIISDTDILIGMHGAGLTHIMFPHDWAVVFELYNCGDVNCYADLARLRGVRYLTWKDDNKLTRIEDPNFKDGKGPHLKHSNYEFDAPEFLRLVNECISFIKTTKYSEHDEL